MPDRPLGATLNGSRLCSLGKFRQKTGERPVQRVTPSKGWLKVAAGPVSRPARYRRRGWGPPRPLPPGHERLLPQSTRGSRAYIPPLHPQEKSHETPEMVANIDGPAHVEPG